MLNNGVYVDGPAVKVYESFFLNVQKTVINTEIFNDHNHNKPRELDINQ